MRRLLAILLFALAVPALGAPAASAAASPADPVAEAMARGYLQAATDGKGGAVTGPLFFLGDIKVTGTRRFSAAGLGLQGFAGEPATAANVKAAGEAARRWFLDHGFPFATVRLDIGVRPAPVGGKPLVDLVVEAVPGEAWKYGGYKAHGSRTKPEVLERLALLEYGEDYGETRLRKAEERLARTGYYEAIVPGTLYRDSSRNLLYPTLSLTDLKGNRLDGLLGYDSEKDGSAGVNGFLDIHLINLRGTGRDLDFSFRGSPTSAGVLEKDARLAFVEPWVLGSPLGLRMDAHFNLEDSVYGEGSGEIQIFQDLDFHSRYFISGARQYTFDYITGEETSADVAGLGLLYDARDRVPHTLRGARVATRVNGLRRELGDSAYYLAQSINQIALWANKGRWVAHGLLSGSGNWPLEGRENRGELFQLGGSNTIRGYREKEFLTNLFAYANLEMQFILAPGSRASVFVVPGFINRLGGDIHWRHVVGYGLGLESGTRDWTFGVSYALNPDRDFGNGFVHLRVINNF